jgi:hypothetical protein
MTAQIKTPAEKREEVLKSMTPAQREIYACFTSAVLGIYGTALLPDCYVALKGVVAVMQAQVNSHFAGGSKVEPL